MKGKETGNKEPLKGEESGIESVPRAPFGNLVENMKYEEYCSIVVMTRVLFQKKLLRKTNNNSWLLRNRSEGSGYLSFKFEDAQIQRRPFQGSFNPFRAVRIPFVFEKFRSFSD
jgi:hypothetical protein